jgi:hypothetical protein
VARAGTPGTAPERSVEQRLGALQKANKIRVERSRLKKDLAAGQIQISDVLAHPPACAETERVSVLLLAVPMYGPARVSKLLLRERISETKRLGGLSDRQRHALIQHFPHHLWKTPVDRTREHDCPTPSSIRARLRVLTLHFLGLRPTDGGAAIVDGHRGRCEIDRLRRPSSRGAPRGLSSRAARIS